jgi:hypothetical protein
MNYVAAFLRIGWKDLKDNLATLWFYRQIRRKPGILRAVLYGHRVEVTVPAGRENIEIEYSVYGLQADIMGWFHPYLGPVNIEVIVFHPGME